MKYILASLIHNIAVISRKQVYVAHTVYYFSPFISDPSIHLLIRVSHLNISAFFAFLFGNTKSTGLQYSVPDLKWEQVCTVENGIL
jgi:hypothetical protein